MNPLQAVSLWTVFQGSTELRLREEAAAREFAATGQRIAEEVEARLLRLATISKEFERLRGESDKELAKVSAIAPGASRPINLPPGEAEEGLDATLAELRQAFADLQHAVVKAQGAGSDQAKGYGLGALGVVLAAGLLMYLGPQALAPYVYVSLLLAGLGVVLWLGYRSPQTRR